jgi:hypothetical protein
MAPSDVGDAGVCTIGGNEAFTPRRMMWKPSSLVDRLCPSPLAETGTVTLVHHTAAPGKISTLSLSSTY